ncbi:hypothetical protein NHQ30_008345 [Ciborinia camelliae]|nr:hypothetical protein NHQ30_008345 [Ciborinia camelliae]
MNNMDRALESWMESHQTLEMLTTNFQNIIKEKKRLLDEDEKMMAENRIWHEHLARKTQLFQEHITKLEKLRWIPRINRTGGVSQDDIREWHDFCDNEEQTFFQKELVEHPKRIEAARASIEKIHSLDGTILNRERLMEEQEDYVMRTRHLAGHILKQMSTGEEDQEIIDKRIYDDYCAKSEYRSLVEEGRLDVFTDMAFDLAQILRKCVTDETWHDTKMPVLSKDPELVAMLVVAKRLHADQLLVPSKV